MGFILGGLMKTARIIIIMMITVLVLSIGTPATASAKTNDRAALTSGVNSTLTAKTKIVTLTIINQTGGSLYITINAFPYAMRYLNRNQLKSYLFLARAQGQNQFQILAGRYTFSIHSSNCGGRKINTKIFDGDVTLGPYYCDK
jgi:hypothetical protein